MSRAAATKFFIDKIDSIQPGNDNVEMYKTYFKGLSDKAFSTLMDKLESGEETLPFYIPPLKGKPLSIQTLLNVGDSLGIDFFQQLWLTDSITGVKYLTTQKYLILDIPVRRQSQHLMKGKSVSLNSKYTDNLTGQATGVSRSSRISLPEIMSLESAGHVKSIEEMIKVRGGDPVALRKAKRLLIDRGYYNLDEIAELGTRPISTETTRAFLLAMHLDNNI